MFHLFSRREALKRAIGALLGLFSWPRPGGKAVRPGSRSTFPRLVAVEDVGPHYTRYIYEWDGRSLFPWDLYAVSRTVTVYDASVRLPEVARSVGTVTVYDAHGQVIEVRDSTGVDERG